jgi:hypothetical protein
MGHEYNGKVFSVHTPSILYGALVGGGSSDTKIWFKINKIEMMIESKVCFPSPAPLIFFLLISKNLQHFSTK